MTTQTVNLKPACREIYQRPPAHGRLRRIGPRRGNLPDHPWQFAICARRPTSRFTRIWSLAFSNWAMRRSGQ